MADSSHLAPLVELPYGTRQRIVVVPDDVLEAENDAGDQDQPRRPWGLPRGDPRHPTLKAIKAADDDGLRLLPVRQSYVGQLDMPIGHPLPNVVYIGSPAVAERYYPVADFHVRVFEERFGEAMRLLMALGAQRLTVRSEHGWKRDISTNLEVPIKRVLKNQAKLRIGSRRDRSHARSPFRFTPAQADQLAAEFVAADSDGHVSDSAVQRRAEEVIRTLLSQRLGVPLAPRTIKLAAGASVQVDAVSDDGKVLAEIFARQGPLKAGQQKKVAIDTLKLITVHRERPAERLIICFADHEASTYATGGGWVAQALRTWGVHVEIVDIPAALRAEILGAQAGQTMVNPT